MVIHYNYLKNLYIELVHRGRRKIEYEPFLNLIWKSQNTSVLAKENKKLIFFIMSSRLNMLSNYRLEKEKLTYVYVSESSKWISKFEHHLLDTFLSSGMRLVYGNQLEQKKFREKLFFFCKKKRQWLFYWLMR